MTTRSNIIQIPLTTKQFSFQDLEQIFMFYCSPSQSPEVKEGKCSPHPYTLSHTTHLHTHALTGTHIYSTHTLTLNLHTHILIHTVSRIHSYTLPHICTHTKVFHWPQRSPPSHHVWEWAPSARWSALRKGKGSSLVWDRMKMEPYMTWVAAQTNRAE